MTTVLLDAEGHDSAHQQKITPSVFTFSLWYFSGEEDPDTERNAAVSL